MALPGHRRDGVARGTSIGLNLDDVVFIPVETAMRMFNRTSLFRGWCGANPREIERARRVVERVLADRHDGEVDVTVLTQDSVLSTFGDILGC